MLHRLPDWVTAPKERRRLHRFPVEMPATLISSALGRVQATVLDLSQVGCRIRVQNRCHRDEHFVLTIASLEPRSVAAMWCRDGHVGLMFAEPLGWATLMRLIAGEGGEV